MFGKSDSLPLHGGSQRNNGISGMPVVNKSVALSLVWVAASIAVFIFGIWHCRNNSYNYMLKCSETQCKYTAFRGTEVSFTFPKSDLIDADLARLDLDGEYLDAEAMRKQKSNRAGYSIRFKARLPVEEGSQIKVEKAIVLVPYDMGRREARNGVTSITKYIHTGKATRDEDDEKKGIFGKSSNKYKEINVNFGRSLTAVGALSSLFAVFSLIAAFMFGTWSEKSRNARVKKAS